MFAIVDHSGEAEKVGLKMRPTKLVIFGSPKAGTPLMLAAPGIATDLPLKILISEDPGGNVWVSYNSPTYLQERRVRAVARRIDLEFALRGRGRGCRVDPAGRHHVAEQWILGTGRHVFAVRLAPHWHHLAPRREPGPLYQKPCYACGMVKVDGRAG